MGADAIRRMQFIKSIILDRMSEGNDIKSIVTLPYVLTVDPGQKVVGQYYLTHTYDAYFVRTYQFWNNATVYENIKLIDPNTLATMVQPDSLGKLYVQVYKLNSIVSSFKEYARWRVPGQF